MWQCLYWKHTINIQENNGQSFLRCPKYYQKQTKSDSFDDHYEQHFKPTTSHNGLHKCMYSKVVKHLNLIGEMKQSKKPNWNLYEEERLTIIKSYVIKMSHLWTKIRKYIGPTGTDNFISILPKHWWSHYWAKGIDCKMDLNPPDFKFLVVLSTK